MYKKMYRKEYVLKSIERDMYKKKYRKGYV